MNFVPGPLLMVVFFVALVIVVVIQLRLRAQKQREWRLWASNRGWVLHDDWQQMVGQFKHGPFGQGSSRSAQLGYDGTFDGLSASGFGYKYSTGAGNTERTHRFHISFVRVPGAQFPTLTLATESWVNRVLTEDIQFEDAEFNRRWWVNSPSPRFAHDVIHPRLMHWLNTTPLPGFSTLWFEGDAILVATPGLLTPDDVDARLRLLTRMAAIIPRFVLNDAGCRDQLQITDDGPGIPPEA